MAKQDPTPRIIFTDLIEDDKPQAMAWVKETPLPLILAAWLNFMRLLTVEF